jgi:hypothetical protein
MIQVKDLDTATGHTLFSARPEQSESVHVSIAYTSDIADRASMNRNAAHHGIFIPGAPAAATSLPAARRDGEQTQLLAASSPFPRCPGGSRLTQGVAKPHRASSLRTRRQPATQRWYATLSH